MPQWPLPIFPTKGASAPRASSFMTVSNVTSGVAHTKGAWVQLSASVGVTGGQWMALSIGTTGASATDTATLLDIGFGAAASETVVISNLQVGFLSDRYTYLVPFYVPAGTRVATRIQSVQASKVVSVGLDVWGGDPDSSLTTCNKITTYGSDTATSRGAILAPNASANVKGSYVQLTAATTAPIHGAIVSIQGTTALFAGARDFTVDVATGAAASEVVVIADVPTHVFSSDVFTHVYAYLPVSLDIPVGSRIAARVSSSSASSESVAVALHGFTF